MTLGSLATLHAGLRSDLGPGGSPPSPGPSPSLHRTRAQRTSCSGDSDRGRTGDDGGTTGEQVFLDRPVTVVGGVGPWNHDVGHGGPWADCVSVRGVPTSLSAYVGQGAAIREGKRERKILADDVPDVRPHMVPPGLARVHDGSHLRRRAAPPDGEPTHGGRGGAGGRWRWGLLSRLGT